MATRFSQTRFANGLNIGATSKGDGAIPVPLGDIGAAGQGWSSKIIDFRYPEDISTGTTAHTVTVETTGTIAYTAGGVKLQPKDTTDNSSVLLSDKVAGYFLATTQKIYMEVACKVDLESGGAMAQQQFFAGFASVQTGSNFMGTAGTTLTMDDAFGFYQLDAGTSVNFASIQSDVQQLVGSSAVFQDGVVTRLGVYYDGTTFTLYQDGLQVGSATKTVFNNDAAMAPTLYIKNGEAKAHDLTVYYLAVAQTLV